MIRDAAIAAGMVTLGEDALSKVKSGATSAEELFRVVTEVKEVRTLCSGCHAAVGVDFMACPHCGHRLNAGCPKCGRSLQAEWQFCPVLHDQHGGANRRRSSCAISSGRRSCRRRTSLNSRTRPVVEELLRHALGDADAPADEIKKAFRREIARYHPDKVQHLGQEFQEMAAGHRRRSDRGLPDPDGSGAAREVRRRSARPRRVRTRRRIVRVRRRIAQPQPPPPRGASVLVHVPGRSPARRRRRRALGRCRRGFRRRRRACRA